MKKKPLYRRKYTMHELAVLDVMANAPHNYNFTTGEIAKYAGIGWNKADETLATLRRRGIVGREKDGERNRWWIRQRGIPSETA